MSNTEPGTQLTVVGNLKTPAYRGRLTALIPRGSYEFGALMAQVALACDKNPEIEKCSEKSIVATVATFAAWGAEIGRDGYMIPYKGVCTPVFYYGYLCALVQICTGYVPVAENVFEGDFFEYEQGSHASVRHKPASLMRKPKGAFLGTYAYLPQPGGRVYAIWIPADELEAHRRKHSHQWKNGEAPSWYHPKTALKRLIKTLPKSPNLARLHDLMKRDEAEEAHIAEAEVSSVETVREPASAPESAITRKDGEVINDADFEFVDETKSDEAPDGVTLPMARAMRIVGKPTEFGNHGGKRFDECGSTFLTQYKAWLYKKMEEPGSLTNVEEMIRGAQLVLEARERGELPAKSQPSKEPAGVGAGQGDLPWDGK